MKVLFFPQRSKIRLYKIVKAVKHMDDVEAVLVCAKSYYDKNLFEGLFSEVHYYIPDLPFERFKSFRIFYRKIKESTSFGFRKLRKIVDLAQPDIIHAFCEPYNHINFLLKNTNIPVVVSDGNDFSGISAGIELLPKKIKDQEKYSLENVAGICHKGPKKELDYYRNHGYEINCSTITWMDFCDDDLFSSSKIEKLSSKDGEVHVVYTGIVSEDPDVLYINYLELARAFARQKIHFHIYSTPEQFNTLNKYIELDRKEAYFHFHKPLKYQLLTSEISKYDFGMWWHDPKGEDRFTSFKQEVSIGNKFYTYLEAGLPVIIGENLEHGCKITREYNLGVVVSKNALNNLHEKLSEYNVANLQESVMLNRNKLSISNKSADLKAFYEEVLNSA